MADVAAEGIPGDAGGRGDVGHGEGGHGEVGHGEVGHGDGGGTFVLILDDSASQGHTLVQLCRALHVRAANIDTTTHAREILNRLRPNAVITDIVMPGHNGFDIMQFIASMNPDLPVMVATSSQELLTQAAGAMQQKLRLSNVVFVKKPVRSTDLRNFLSDAGLLTAKPVG